MNSRKRGNSVGSFATNPHLLRALLLLSLLSLLLDALIERHETLGFAGWFGFYAAFSLFACLVLPLAARLLRRLLLRPVDYYREGPKP